MLGEFRCIGWNAKSLGFFEIFLKKLALYGFLRILGAVGTLSNLLSYKTMSLGFIQYKIQVDIWQDIGDPFH